MHSKTADVASEALFPPRHPRIYELSIATLVVVVIARMQCTDRHSITQWLQFITPDGDHQPVADLHLPRQL